MVFEWYDEEASATVYIHTAYANSPDGTVDFTLNPPDETEEDDAPVYLYTGQYEDDDPNENSNPEDYVWTFTDYDPAQEPEDDGEVAEPPELDPLAAAGLPGEAVRQITDNSTNIGGNQDASDQTITNPNELVGTNHGVDGYTVTSGLAAASLPDPVYAEGDTDIECCRITCQTAANNATVSFQAEELESRILASVEDGSTYTLSFDIRMSSPAATGAITLGDLLSFDAFDPDDYLIVEDDPPEEEEEAEEEEAEGDDMEEDDDGSEVDDDEEPPEPGPIDITDEWVHFVAHAVVDPNGTAGATLTIPVDMASGDTLDIANLKIEAGDLATPWKPSVIEAQAAADNALAMARATNKHFFYANSTGAHVTTVEGDPDSGNNVLIDSNGLYIREDTDVLAEFTADGAVVGKADEARTVIGKDSVSIYADDTTRAVRIGIKTSVVSADWETASWTGTINAGATKTMALGHTPTSDCLVSAIYSLNGDRVVAQVLLESPVYQAEYGWFTYSISGSTLTYKNNNDENISFSMLMVYGDVAVETGGSFEFGTAADAVGADSVSMGTGNTSSGRASFATGFGTGAIADYAFAEGEETEASGRASHAEGRYCTAAATASHAEGLQCETTITGTAGHAQNAGTIAASFAQTAIGQYNVADPADTYALIIGNGADNNTRANALTVDWDGNINCSGIKTDSKINFVSSQNPNYTGSYIHAVNGDANGSDMIVNSGGRFIAGGGEYASNRYNAGSFEGAEATWIGSDSAVFIESNGNTITSRNKWTFSASGDLIAPNGAVYEAAYKGETVTLTGANLIGNGYSGASAIYIELPLPKKIAKGSSVNLTTFTAGLRGVKGTIAANRTNLLANTTVARSNAGGLLLTISGQTTNFMANTPVSAVVSNLTITVS